MITRLCLMPRLQMLSGFHYLPGVRMIPGPSSLLRRVGVGLRSGSTLASLADDLATIHGDTTAVTEEYPDGTVRVLTHREVAEVVGRYSASIAARSEPGEPVVVATPNGIDQLPGVPCGGAWGGSLLR
ncbi:MAG: hypothetical protein M5U19_04230 [Microthrixaceae bacterium]|nr:hypothetical protein [Microthrixaceae bacterium]